ncbi:MAG: amidase family protein [Treponema sp.]|nr:amidase family protein [Treponema sp.]
MYGSNRTEKPPALPPEAVSLVNGIPFAVKDNIAVKDMLFTCGLNLLKNFYSPYTATIVQKLEQAGGIVSAMINTSGDSPAAAEVPYALASDLGCMRQQAALYGMAALKPTYGAVSRYGIAACAPSLETAGIVSDTVSRCRSVFAHIRGKDPNDQTSFDAPPAALYPALGGGKKIGFISYGDDEALNSFELAKKQLAAAGHTLFQIDLPCIKYGAAAFHTIAAAETASSMARFDGIRYGTRSAADTAGELVRRTRAENITPEVKMQILLGTFVLRPEYQDMYYLRAQKIREGIRRNLESLLAEYDAILLPVCPNGKKTQKENDFYTCLANLAGLPALSFPVSTGDGVPFGVQLLGRAYAEAILLDIGEEYEKKYPFFRPKSIKAFGS